MIGIIPLVIGAIVAAPFLVVAGGISAFRRRRGAAHQSAAADDPDQETLAALDQLIAHSRGVVPDTVEARIDRIAATVRATIPRLDQLGTGSAEAHTVLRTATRYLPEAVAAYLRLPRDFADRRAVSNGKTSLSVLCDQLDLLASKMDEVFDAACRADADALIAHGRFLAEKFGSGALALDPEKR